MNRLSIALALAIALPSCAFAADAATTAVDIGLFLNSVVFPLLGLAVTWLVWRVTPALKAKLGADAGAQAANLIDAGLHYALAYGQDKASTIGAVDVRSATVTQAMAYAQREFPDLLKRNGIDEVSLKAKLEARYAYNTTPPEQSAAIPTPPASTSPG